MNSEPLRRSHLVRAAMMRIGVPPREIETFLEKVDREGIGETEIHTWNRRLSLAEISEFAMILDEKDLQQCENVLSFFLDEIADLHHVTKREVRSWTGPGAEEQSA